jgi:hypothetical protein
MMHGVIFCKYQDEVDLWIDKCTDHRVENWADVRYLWDFRNTQVDVEHYLKQQTEQTILVVAAMPWFRLSTYKNYTICGVKNWCKFGHNRSSLTYAHKFLDRQLRLYDDE